VYPLKRFYRVAGSYVLETVTFETETWLKLRDRDFIKNPET